MGKKTDETKATVAELRAKVAGALAVLGEAKEQYEAATKEHEACSQAAYKAKAAQGENDWRFEKVDVTVRRLERDLKVASLDTARLEAEDKILRATSDAAILVDALEEAQGDELILACSDQAFDAESATFDAEEVQLQEALAAVAERRAARRQILEEAKQQLSARRKSQGLPPPSRETFSGVSDEHLRKCRSAEWVLRDRLAPLLRRQEERAAMNAEIERLYEERRTEAAELQKHEAEAWRAKCEAERQENAAAVAAAASGDESLFDVPVTQPNRAGWRSL